MHSFGSGANMRTELFGLPDHLRSNETGDATLKQLAAPGSRDASVLLNFVSVESEAKQRKFWSSTGTTKHVQR